MERRQAKDVVLVKMYCREDTLWMVFRYLNGRRVKQAYQLGC